MPSCKACAHPNHDAINEQIVRGVPFRTIVGQTQLSLGCLHRHKTHCIKPLVQEAMRAAQGERAEQGSELFKRLEEIIAAAKNIAARASREGNFATANSALNTIVRCAELLARASGELALPNTGGLHFHSTKNVTNIVNIQSDDLEVALLISEATDGYNPDVIQRMKQLAEASKPALTFTDVSPAS